MNFNYDTGLIDTIQTLDCSELPPLGGTAGVLTIIGTGAIAITGGTQAQRPAGVAGMFRFNSDTTLLEYYDGSSWNPLSTSSSTVSSVAATSNSAGLSISGSPITNAGTFQFTLSSSLEAISDLGGSSSTGLIAQTGIGTFTDVTIYGTSDNISVSNGDGVAGNPTIDLVNVGTPVSNSFVKVTTDAKGRVTSTSSVTNSDITTSLGYTPVNKAGDTNVGSISMAANADITFNGGTVTGLPNPTNATDAANKSYVDGLAGGITAKAAVRAATTGNLSVSGAGTQASRTLTATSNGSLVVDGITLDSGDRLLVKDQSTTSDNGVYTVTSVGDSTHPFVLTRASDFNGVFPGTVAAGDFVFVEDGNTLSNTGWVVYVSGNTAITVDTDAITWTQFTGSGAVTLAFAGDSGSPDVLVSGQTLHIVGTVNQVSTLANGTNNITISLPQDIATTSTPEFVTVKLSDLAASSAVFTDANNNLISQSLTDGQLFIGSSSGAPAAASLTAGTGVSISNSSNSITISNIGVTSIAGTTNQITASASTGAVTLSLPANVFVSTAVQIGTSAQGAAFQTAPTGNPSGFAIFSTSVTQSATNYTLGFNGSVTDLNGTSDVYLSINGTPIVTVSSSGISISGTASSSGFIGNLTGNATSATNIAGGTAGEIAYQTGAGATSFIAAGTSSQVLFGGATPGFRTLAYSDLPIKLYVENPSTPPTTTATGANAIALAGGTASADNSFAVGQGASASIYGADVFANGSFSSSGDAQGGTYVMRNATTDNTSTELFLDGAAATQRLIFGNNSVVTFDILVSARRTDATGGGAGYRFLGVAKKDTTAGSNAIVGAVSKTVIGETNAAWDANVTADTTTGALAITVTGENSKTVRWVAVVRTTEVTN